MRIPTVPSRRNFQTTATVVLAVLLSVFGCQGQASKQPDTAPSKGVSTATAPTPEETTTEVDVTQVNTAEQIAVNLPALRADNTVSQLPPTAMDKLIADETSRLDPQVDGWSTESFNETALTQLRSLASWFDGGSEAAGFPTDVFASNVASTDLRPNNLETVLEESGFQVKRWTTDPTLATNVKTAEELATMLRQLLAVNEQPHAEFKIIGVSEIDGGMESRVRCHLSAAGSKYRVQQNADWKCTWTETESDKPKLSSIELLEFEEVQSTSPLAYFTDRTPSVLNGNDCYSEQLAYPLDYWRDRIDWRFGWEVVGAHGIAVGDLTGDGLDDVYFCETGGLPNRLLAQQPDGTVRDISKESGLDIIEPTRGALIVDLDNDGDQDMILAVARFVLAFENLGNAKFKQHAGLQSGSMIRSLAAADYNNDGLLDFYACGYSLRTPDSIGLGRPLPYHDANNGAPSYLLHNQGGFRFSDVTQEVGLNHNNTRFSYAAAWEDFDNDGDLDLYVANDFGRNNLYRNDGGHFTDIAAEAGVEDVAAGMSVSWGDFNRDGLPDIYVGNMFSSAGNRIAYQRQFRADIDEETRTLYQRHARGNSLFQNMGDGTFRDVSQTAAVTEARWAWSSNFTDINNDGWQDLIVANGMVTGTDDTGDL